MINQKNKVIIGKVLLLIGIILFVIGMKEFFANNKFKKENEKIVAKVTDSNKENKYTSVSFYLNGKEYKTAANDYKPAFKTGDDVEIYYNVDDPNVILLSNSNQGFLMPLVGAIVSILIGMSFSIQKGNNTIKAATAVKESGTKIEATIIKVVKNTKVKANGVNPYYVICKWTNKRNGHEYTFKSADVWYDPDEQLVKAGIEKVPVYVNPKDPSQYYVDLESVNSENSGFKPKKPQV